MLYTKYSQTLLFANIVIWTPYFVALIRQFSLAIRATREFLYTDI